jgi:thiamine-phosphate pyrophosphorylase
MIPGFCKLKSMQLCAITDRRALGEDEGQRTERPVALAAAWARGGVDYIQVREKDLKPTELEAVVRRVVEAGISGLASGTVSERVATKVLVNGHAPLAASVAFGAGADGVHLPGGFTSESLRISMAAVRRHFASRAAVVSVACHLLTEVKQARDAGADLVLFAPVFGKVVGALSLPGVGLELLAAACEVAGTMPVFALGGVTAENARDCVDAGASGVAGIRLFLDQGWDAL